MPAVRCPDCRADVALPAGVRSGDLVECPNCAGPAIRVREECDRLSAALACQMAGSRVTLALLIVATLVVGTSIVLDRFPEFTSDVLAHVMNSDAGHSGHDMGGMR